MRKRLKKCIVGVLVMAMAFVGLAVQGGEQVRMQAAEDSGSGVSSETVITENWMTEKSPYWIGGAEGVDTYIAKKGKWFTIGGKNYDEGMVFKFASTVFYNLKSEYSNFSFCMGHIDNTGMEEVDLNIYADGNFKESIHMTPSDLSIPVSIDVNNVNQLMIQSDGGTWGSCYGMYNGSFTRSGIVAEDMPPSNMIGNIEPYQIVGTNTKIIRSKDNESFLMGGDKYTDCLQIGMFDHSKIYFNFDGEYKSMTFLLGPIDNSTDRQINLNIELDGEIIQTVTSTGRVLPVSVTVPLEGVHQMVLSSKGYYGSYDDRYGIGAIQLKSLGNVKGIAFDRETMTLTDKNPSFKLKASITPSDANNKNIIWSSDNESVAKVDENGVVTAVARGDAVISATTEEGAYKATCAVTVDMEEKQSGDVERNGSIDLDDALAVLKAALKITVLQGEALEAADVDGDGDVTLDDALQVLKKALKIIEEFTVASK